MDTLALFRTLSQQKQYDMMEFFVDVMDAHRNAYTVGDEALCQLRPFTDKLRRGIVKSS